MRAHLVLLATVTLLAGCDLSSGPSVESKLHEAAAGADGTIYYVGPEYEGLPLVEVQSGPEAAYGGVSFIYGECEVEMHGTEGGCVPPLQIQNAVCSGSTTRVSIFADGVNVSADEAEAALRPLPGSPAGSRAIVSHSSGPFCGER
jgi:hypothetical protein